VNPLREGEGSVWSGANLGSTHPVGGGGSGVPDPRSGGSNSANHLDDFAKN